MDFESGPRAKVAKYGRNKNRIQLHDFYSIQAAPTTVPSTSKRLPISPASIGNENHDQDSYDVPINPPSPSPARSPRPAHVTSHSGSSFGTSHDSRSVSPAKNEMIKPSSTRGSTYEILASAFDMPSSDEESDPAQTRPVKKIRLSPITLEKKQEIPKKKTSRLLDKSETTDHKVLPKKRETVRSISGSGRTDVAALGKKRSSQDMMKSEVNDMPAEPNIATEKISKPAKLVRSDKHKIGMQSDMSLDNEVHKSTSAVPRRRTKLKSRPVGSSTPRKARQRSEHSDTSGASPSQLGMDHLRLTTDSTPENMDPSPISPVAEPTRLLPRGRTRLIDRLDTGTSKSVPRSEAISNFARQLENLQQGDEVERPTLVSEKPKLVRSNSPKTRQTYGKPRNTYAKERSHLSDMLDDVDAMSITSTQGASQQFLTGMLNAGPSHLQSQLELESDSSDGAPTSRLKSVHELRQAGANNRLEKEVEDLMQDINPTSGNKAVRLTALMQVMRKMSHERFAVFLLNHALERLTEWSLLMKDKVSKLLLGMIFWRLVHGGTMSPTRLKQIIHCVVSNSSALPPLDTIAQIAKSRAENLAKSTVRDLVEFEQTIIKDGLLPAYEDDCVIPAAITLGVLNDSLRKMIEAGSLNALPRSSYPQIIALLEQVSQPSSHKPVKHVFVTKLAISLLSICAGPLEQDLGMASSECSTLSSTLSDVLDRSMNIHEDLVQAILHFAITLCNDKPDICKVVSQSNLPDTLLRLITSRFLDYVNAAKNSQETDASKLDSIILTLACLLNITEHSNDVRRTFATSKTTQSKTTHLSELVAIYISAPKPQNVHTTEQTSGLVAVGYLALLICNLCLDDVLWTHVAKQLSNNGYGISDVVASAKELLIHLRTLETIADEDMDGQKAGEADGISVRFGEILSAVRLE